MIDSDASASKGRTWYERALDEAMSLFVSFSPVVLLGLVLILLADWVTWLLHWFGVGNAMPGLPNNEGVVVLLAGIVISLLLVILRGLGRILDRVEAVENILSSFDASTGEE